MTSVTFDPVYFRLRYPAFSDDTVYTDFVLEEEWATNECIFINETTCALNETCLSQVLYLLLAHTLTLDGTSIPGAGDQTTANGQVSTISSATVDKVSVSYESNKTNDESQFTEWLDKTVYGQKILQILNRASAGGFYFPGAPNLRLNSVGWRYGR
jgi:hypothetical protein